MRQTWKWSPADIDDAGEVLSPDDFVQGIQGKARVRPDDLLQKGDKLIAVETRGTNLVRGEVYTFSRWGDVSRSIHLDETAMELWRHGFAPGRFVRA